MAVRNALPFEFPYRWGDVRRFFGKLDDEAVDYLDQRDRDLEDFLAAPSPATLRGCSAERDSHFGTSPVQAVPNATFTTLNFDVVNYNDGNFDGAIYTVPVRGVYSTVVRLRLPDNLAATFSYGAGVHTSNVDGAWFLWGYSSDSTLGSGTSRSSIQITRIKAFQAGDQLRAYCYIDRGASTNVMSSAFDVIYEGSPP